MQIKELEDSLAAAHQSYAHLQTQLDAASASARSQATDLSTAQAEASQLRADVESLQSQLRQEQSKQKAGTEVSAAQEAAAASREQQWVLQVRSLPACLVHLCHV